MSERSGSERQSSRSRRSRHRRSRRSGSEREEPSRREEDFTEGELYDLAAKSRDRQAIREFRAAIYCHGLTENGIRRAKRRQDYYFGVKGFLLYIQMICVLLVTFMAVIVFHNLHKGTESVYFASELFIETMILFFLLLVILFEHEGLRFSVPLVMLTAFFLNVMQIVYYLLFDSVAIECERIDRIYGSLACLMRHLPMEHMSVYVAIFLGVLHFVGFIAGWLLLHFYPGTIIHLIDLAKEVGFTACVTFFAEAEKARRRNRERERRKRHRSRRRHKSPFVPDVNTSKLPVGTVITAERTSTYKFKGNVQPRKVVIGSGQEIANEVVTLQAPNKEAVKRETKVVRHVMIDGVREKVKTDSKATTSAKTPSTTTATKTEGKAPLSAKTPPTSTTTTKTESKDVKGDKKSPTDVKQLTEGQQKGLKTGDMQGSSRGPTYNVVQEMQPRESSRSLLRSEPIKKD